ncbi:MAG: ABC transporter permease [Lachnospiraceae bacterium]
MALKKKFLPYIMVLPSMLLLVVVVFYPIITSLVRSFELETGGYGLDNYLYFFQNKLQRDNLFYTLKIVVITLVLAISISYFLALYLRFVNTKVSKIIEKLYLMPRFVPGLVAVNGMITVIRDSGLINRIGRVFGANWELGLMYNDSGIIVMNLWFNIPFATMLLLSALSAIQTSTIEAARDVGASKMKILRSMILPLTFKDILVASTFVLMGNIGSFTTPYLIGENSPQMLGVSLYKLFNNMRYEKAAALSMIIFLLSCVSAVVYIYANMKKEQWEG